MKTPIGAKNSARAVHGEDLRLHTDTRALRHNSNSGPFLIDRTLKAVSTRPGLKLINLLPIRVRCHPRRSRKVISTKPAPSCAINEGGAEGPSVCVEWAANLSPCRLRSVRRQHGLIDRTVHGQALINCFNFRPGSVAYTCPRPKSLMDEEGPEFEFWRRA
jgi:hypothetical protein